jgi:hypothetical protein
MGVAELLTDADNYTIQFNQNVKLSAEQKTTILSAQLLGMYMYIYVYMYMNVYTDV